MSWYNPKHFPPNIFKLFIVILLCAFAQGCKVTMVSAYDEKTDNAVTQFQKDLETFFVSVEGQSGAAGCDMNSHKTFYDKATVDIRAMKLRASSMEKNQITIDQLDLLEDSFGDLKDLHEIACLADGQITALRSSFNSHITAILKFELAKKRGSDD